MSVITSEVRSGDMLVGHGIGPQVWALGQHADRAEASVYPGEWKFTPGVYTVDTFMREISVLLESVILQLGPDPPGATSSREIFFDSLRSSLSHEGREATLPLSDWKSKNPSEITKQALRVGKLIYQLARKHSEAVPGDSQLKIFSPCEGHKWVPPAGKLLRSSRSSPNLMMLFNEWKHQITCLRNFLLAFENPEDVQLILTSPAVRGTRAMESLYEPILRCIEMGKLDHDALLGISKVLTAPALPKGGYGFQYSGGLVLPTALFERSGSPFLRYISAQVIPAQTKAVLFEPGASGQVKDGTPPAKVLKGNDLAIEAEQSAKGTCHLKVTALGEDGNRSFADVGAIVAALRASA